MAQLTIPSATSPLREWLAYLENLHSLPIDLDIKRVSQVAKQLQLLIPAPYVITVAGTNGKGTTCRCLEALLIAAGYRVGVYSSPHLIRYTERVRIQGVELSEQQHSASFDRIEQSRAGVSLSYFEFGTLSALQLFRESDLDVVILEVGLGGRLDATNIVDSQLAVITSIDLDHTDWLGPDRESIGREKAGIFRQHCPAIVGEATMPTSITQVANETGAQLLKRGEHWDFQLKDEVWHFRDNKGELCALPLPRIPLANAATALAALRVSNLIVSEQIIRNNLCHISLAGRFQTVSTAPHIILDVAHNPHAARYLAEQIASIAKGARVRAVVGMLHDKDIAGTLRILNTVIDEWYCATLPGPRGAKAAQLSVYLQNERNFDSVVAAWQAAMANILQDDILIVCGSFITVAEVMTQLALENNNGE